MIAVMGKKKSDVGDRHKKRWMIGLPMSYRALFDRLAETNRRPLTTEVLIALEAHLKAAGLWPSEGIDQDDDQAEADDAPAEPRKRGRPRKDAD